MKSYIFYSAAEKVKRTACLTHPRYLLQYHLKHCRYK